MADFDETLENEDYEEESTSDFGSDEALAGSLSSESVANILQITSDKFTREQKVIKIDDIGFSEPMKIGRKKTLTGLTQSIKELGVVTPIHVMAVPEEDAEDGYRYIMIDGMRRTFGALKNGIKEIDAVVWSFEDNEKGMDFLLVLSLILNRAQKRRWSEIWDLYEILEMQFPMTPGTLEYLLQLNGGEAMKLKDVMLCEYSEVKEALLSGQKDLEGSYKLLQKLRKEEDQLAKDDATGISDTAEEATDLVADRGTDDLGQLSDQDVMELLEMADDLDSVSEVGEDDFSDMSKVDDSYIDAQRVGDRHPLDPALRQAVLQKDGFTCQCCGMKLIGARLGLIAAHHILPVHVGGKDTLDNLVTLCLNCHVNLHIMERNGGSILMSREDFSTLSESEQLSLKKALKLARVAIEADKRKGLSKKAVRELTEDSIKHPMPGDGMKENEIAYSLAKSGSVKVME